MGLIVKKIAGIALKAVAGLLVFVLFVVYAVIPIGAPWVIRSQGSKVLGHPVEVRSVWLNPFLLRVSVNGFKVFDTGRKTVLAGFDAFQVDVSFLGLFKKLYRVEYIGLDGLTVNAALLPGNKINLMELVPAQANPSPRLPAAPAPVPASAATPVSPAPLPDAVIDKIAVKDAVITFVDNSVVPPFSTELTGLSLTVTNISTRPGSVANVVFSTRLDKEGVITAESNLRPLARPIELEAEVSLNDYALAVLTPYVGRYTGRAVKSGKMGLTMQYKIANNQLNARHKILIQKFDFGGKVESKDALHLPFGLAVALLEDPQGRISISLPVKGDVSDPKFEYFHLIGQVAGNFLTKLVTSPFTSLMSVLGAESGTEESGSVAFAPGNARLSDKAKEKLTLFVRALKDRPRLSVVINGSYDPQADWKAMKAGAFDAEFAAMRADSARTDFRLVEQMYKFRFGMTGYWALAREYTVNKKMDEPALQAEMKRRIIEEGKPDRAALDRLGQDRATAVYAYMIAGGFDPLKVKTGPSRETQASLGLVPLEFSLTVYEKDETAP